jgi:hypothetical protein
MLNAIMLNVGFYLLCVERRYAKCHYAECRYAEYHYAEFRYYEWHSLC